MLTIIFTIQIKYLHMFILCADCLNENILQRFKLSDALFLFYTIGTVKPEFLNMFTFHTYMFTIFIYV